MFHDVLTSRRIFYLRSLCALYRGSRFVDRAACPQVLRFLAPPMLNAPVCPCGVVPLRQLAHSIACLQLQSQHPFLRHSRAETRIVRWAERDPDTPLRPHGPQCTHSKPVSRTDRRSRNTDKALRAVGGGHFDQNRPRRAVLKLSRLR